MPPEAIQLSAPCFDDVVEPIIIDADDLDPITIDGIILDLAHKQTQLSAYINRRLAKSTATSDEIARLMSLHGQNASRLGRLLRDQQALGGKISSDLQAAIDAALNELGAELGIDL